MTKTPKDDELAEAKRIAARMLAMPPDPRKKPVAARPKPKAEKPAKRVHKPKT